MILIAGPCVIEDEKTAVHIAETLNRICGDLGMAYIFKGSYRKANRTHGLSFKGIGDLKALKILNKISSFTQVLTDVHSVQDVYMAAEYVDILQIPAFLCRQTDLIEAAAKTGKTINIKKGQFATVETMYHAERKISAISDSGVMITERGNFYGYDDLVIDMRNIPLLKQIATTIVDVTHSLGTHAGDPDMISMMARCSIAAGADGIFLETHPRPSEARCDSSLMLPLDMVRPLLKRL